MVHRLEICAEGGAVPPIRAAQARPQIEERDVVVAWNGQHCGPQVVYKRACRAVLRWASALRNVARQHNHIRTLLVGQRAQGFDDRVLLGVLGGIGQQIGSDLHQPFVVTDDTGRCRGQLDLDSVLACFDQRGEQEEEFFLRTVLAVEKLDIVEQENVQ